MLGKGQDFLRIPRYKCHLVTMPMEYFVNAGSFADIQKHHRSIVGFLSRTLSIDGMDWFNNDMPVPQSLLRGGYVEIYLRLFP